MKGIEFQVLLVGDGRLRGELERLREDIEG